MVALVQFAAPEGEPISLADAREQLNLNSDEGEALLNALIPAARDAAESRLNRALITQTWDLYLDQFPCGAIQVPKASLQQVTAITYVDADGATRTLDASRYLVDSASQPGRIAPIYGSTWPVTRCQPNAVKVRFVCGYGAAAAVPAGIKQWILLQVGHWYANREAVGSKELSSLPYVDGLLDPHRVIVFGQCGADA